MNTETARTFPILKKAIAGTLMDEPAANSEAETTLKRFAADFEIADPARILGTSWMQPDAGELAAEETKDPSGEEESISCPLEAERKLDRGPSAEAVILAAAANKLRTSRAAKRKDGSVEPLGRITGISTPSGIRTIGDRFRAPKVAAPRRQGQKSPYWRERDPLAWAEWVHCGGDSRSFDPAFASIPIISLTEAGERLRFVRRRIGARQFGVLVMAVSGATLRKIGESAGFRNGPADSAATMALRCAIEAATEAYRDLDHPTQKPTYH